MNTVGLAGLAAGVQFILDEGIDKIHEREMMHTKRFIKGLLEIPDVILYGGKDEKRQTATMSINIKDMSQSDIGLILDEDYDIMVRVGLHCAPLAHRTIGTLPRGTVRLAAGYFTTDKEVETALRAIREIAENKGKAKDEAKALPRNESICRPKSSKKGKR
jgi:selenocysteine lyase/cysteine desulfurase